MSHRRLLARAVVLAGTAAALSAPASLGAQEILGVAVDSAGRPLPEVPVALHRIGGSSGATVATATTDGHGRFGFTIEAVDSAVYFVALRHEGRLYIGPPARGGVERVPGYVLRASPENEAGAVASALSGGSARPLSRTGQGTAESAPSGPGAGAAWLVLLLALVVAVIFLTTSPGYRRRRRRELVTELARLENRLAAAGPDADTAADRQRRDALRERLSPLV